MASLHHKQVYYEKPLLTAQHVEAGEHLKMVSHYSEGVRNILDTLLQVNEAKRATTMDILRFPGVIDEVNKLILSAEFIHKFTISKNHRSINEYHKRITHKGGTYFK